jgi:hypothetical protein
VSDRAKVADQLSQRPTVPRRAAALLWLLVLGGCGASEAERAVATRSGDADAKFQALRSRAGFVCGEVNARNEQGLRNGYLRFVFDRAKSAAFLDPGAVPAIAVDADEATCRKPLSYQTVDERLSCAQRPRLESDLRRKREFEQLWAQACA